MELQNLIQKIALKSDEQFSGLTKNQSIIARLAYLKEDIHKLQFAVDTENKKLIDEELAIIMSTMLGIMRDLHIPVNKIKQLVKTIYETE